MTRNEYNEARAIEKTLRQYSDLGPGCTLTIRTDASADYKRRLHSFYTGLGFHPASVRVDPHMYDDRERIIYIHGLTWDWNGTPHCWRELYTDKALARFTAALN